jgi:hypothetical protein
LAVTDGDDLTMNIPDDLLWRSRAFIYKQFAEESRPPSVDELTRRFDVSEEFAEATFQELHDRHALFLDPVSAKVRMANPFSAIATEFEVRVAGRSYWANCAWDALGIPAALHADAEVEALYTDTNERLTLTVAREQVADSAARVHFLLPFKHWYDDLILT